MNHHHHTDSHTPTPPLPPSPENRGEIPPASRFESRQRNRAPRNRRNPLLIPLILVSVLALVSTGLYVSTFIDRSVPEARFYEAVEACELDDSAEYISVEDDGESLIMASEGTEYYGAPIEDIACVLYELDVPSSIVNRFDTTRALDGTQTGTWDDFEATWNYHPDSGANITITVVDD